MSPFLTCQNTNNNVKRTVKCDSSLIGKNVIEIDMAIYKINKIFYDYLDTIIVNEEKCVYYDRCISGFSFTIEKSGKNFQIEINSANIYSYDYSECFGVFEYAGYLFICEDLNTKEILNRTKFYKKIKYLNIDRTQWEITHDDRFSTWYFEINNNIIQLRGHHPCPIRNIQ